MTVQTQLKIIIISIRRSEHVQPFLKLFTLFVTLLLYIISRISRKSPRVLVSGRTVIAFLSFLLIFFRLFAIVYRVGVYISFI